MLSVKLQIFMILTFLAVLFFMIGQVRNRKLELRYTLSWLLLAIVLLILAAFPSLLQVMSSAMGIYAPVNMIFFCGFAFSLFIIYTLTVAISKMAEEIKCLAQRIALLEKQAGAPAGGEAAPALTGQAGACAEEISEEQSSKDGFSKKQDFLKKDFPQRKETL